MATTSSCTRTPMSSLLMMPEKPSTNASGFPAVFVVFYIHEMTIRGVYSSLELAKKMPNHISNQMMNGVFWNKS